MSVRRIGKATVQKVEEICGPGFKPARMFPNFDQAAFDAQRSWMEPEFIEPGSDRIIGSVHSWIVRTGQHTMLIDTCLGNHKDRAAPNWNQLNTPFLDRLAAAGIKPEEVDFVMCTHLHVDHVGWNTQLKDGRWVPTFPKAKYLFGKTEYAHWETERKTMPAAEVNGGAFDDSVLPIVEAKRAVFIDAAYQADDLLTLIDAPGHTPGSLCIQLRDGGREALFTGDVMHHPIQVYHPDWSSQFCWDQAMSAKSRRKVLEHCVEHNSLLCPAHFPGPNAGHVEEKHGQFSIEWDRL